MEIDDKVSGEPEQQSNPQDKETVVQGQPSEPKNFFTPDTPLKEIFGDNIPPQLKNFATLGDIAKSKAEAEKYFTRLTQGIVPQSEPPRWTQPQGNYSQGVMTQNPQNYYPQVSYNSPSQQEQPPDFYEDGARYVEYKAKEIARSMFEPLAQQTAQMARALPMLTLVACEPIKQQLRQEYEDFRDIEEHVNAVMLQNAPDVSAFMNPDNWRLAYVWTKMQMEKAGLLPQGSGRRITPVNPIPTEKPTSPSPTLPKESPPITLSPDAEALAKALFGDNPQKIEELKKKIADDLFGGKK